MRFLAACLAIVAALIAARPAEAHRRDGFTLVLPPIYLGPPPPPVIYVYPTPPSPIYIVPPPPVIYVPCTPGWNCPQPYYIPAPGVLVPQPHSPW